MMELEEKDVVVRFVHTADWHLGRSFPAFSPDERKSLSRARLESVDRILGLARQTSSQAILCAGDLFDAPDPGQEWWEPLVAKFAKEDPKRPIFLLPGNHDPLISGSVYQAQHPFYRSLPKWVHVIDQDNFEFEITPGVVLYATPCRSRSGQEDPTYTLPARQPGDQRVRIGMAHGNTFSISGQQTDFPIAKNASARLGMDYLAIGDHHGYSVESPADSPPIVYPGTHEPLNYGESRPGHVVLVAIDKNRKAHLKPQRVAKWTWEEVTCKSLEQLRDLRDLGDRKSHVLSLSLDLFAKASEYQEVESILGELQGTDAIVGRVGILQVDKSGLKLDTSNIENAFDGLPDVLLAAVQRLRELEGGDQDEVARKALLHLLDAVKGKA